MFLGSCVHVTNSPEEELFQCLFCCLVLSPHSHVIGVNSHGGRDLDGGAGAHSMWTRVGQDNNGAVETVVYTTAETVRDEILMNPYHRCELTEVEFWLSFR